MEHNGTLSCRCIECFNKREFNLSSTASKPTDPELEARAEAYAASTPTDFSRTVSLTRQRIDAYLAGALAERERWNQAVYEADKSKASVLSENARLRAALEHYRDAWDGVAREALGKGAP